MSFKQSSENSSKKSVYSHVEKKQFLPYLQVIDIFSFRAVEQTLPRSSHPVRQARNIQRILKYNDNEKNRINLNNSGMKEPKIEDTVVSIGGSENERKARFF